MNIRQVRKKIKSVTNVKKITRAMQLVSAVKMKKFQQAAKEAEPYQDALTSMIRRISATVGKSQSKYLIKPPEGTGKKLAIVIATNKGLCGGFNMHLFRHLLTTVELPRTEFLCVGKRGSEFLSRAGTKIIADYSHADDIDVASALFDTVSQGFFEGTYSEIGIFYNRFVSPIRFDPTYEVMLPFTLQKEEPALETNEGEYLIEPSADEILDRLFRSYLEQKIRFALIQHEAGEHSARMMAMKLATDNATELTFSLTQVRNKIRQQNITYELLDMVTAQAVA